MTSHKSDIFVRKALKEVSTKIKRKLNISLIGILLEKKAFLIAFLIALMVSGSALVIIVHFSKAQTSGTNVSGIITSNTTWTQAGSPYTLTANVLVSNGVTLTIQAGTTVSLGTYYIEVNSTMQAIGTNSSPITFNGGSGAQIIFT